jgi:hypothetical protein
MLLGDIGVGLEEPQQAKREFPQPVGDLFTSDPVAFGIRIILLGKRKRRIV